jgi:hypothetical protein
LPADIWVNRYDIREERLNDGEGFADSSDSSVLAWSQSYVLSSHLAMHEATHKTNYLDKFVDQADEMLANASDLDRDGFLGWGTYRYSVNLVENGGFEYARFTDGSLPDGWTRRQSSPETAFREFGQSKSGDFNVTIRTAPLAGWQILEARTWNALVADNRAYEPDTLYKLSFYGKTNGLAGGRAEVYDYTAGRRLAIVSFNSTAWKVYSTTFRMPRAGGHDIRVRLMNDDYRVPGGSASFDFVRVRQYSEYVVHSGMIATPLAQFAAVVRSDPALQPAYGAAADRYEAFVRMHILPRWEPFYRRIGASGGTYVFPDDGSSSVPRHSLPHNQYLALGRALLWMAEANADVSYAARAARLATTFKRHLHVMPGGGYTWRYLERLLPGDYHYNYVAEDISHANIDVGFAVLAQKAGIVFTAGDLKRFATTLTTRVWNGSWSAPGLRKRVDGSGGPAGNANLSEWADLYDGENRTWQVVSKVLAYRRRWAKSGAYSLLTMANLADDLSRPREPVQGAGT